jgi:hypothetical protein
MEAMFAFGVGSDLDLMPLAKNITPGIYMMRETCVVGSLQGQHDSYLTGV